MNKILIVGMTHGDESIGKEVFSYFQIFGGVDCLISNPVAAREDVRYIDTDLNRSFPGNLYSIYYEERRAYEIATYILPYYDIVIDIHSTITDVEDTIIFPKAYPNMREVVSTMPTVTRCVVIPGTTSLISHSKFGFALEMGKNTEKTINKTINTLTSFLQGKTYTDEKHYYEVFGEVPREEGFESFAKNFVEVGQNEAYAERRDPISGITEYKIAEEPFIPFLFGNNQYENIYGFKMRAIE